MAGLIMQCPPSTRPRPLWLLALAAALVPLLTIHSTYLLAAWEGAIDWCLPYWESCTSISGTGRHGSAYFLFKGTMLPGALLGVLFWWLNGVWLEALGAQDRGTPWLFWLGLVAGLSLGFYTLALGHTGDAFWLMRRIGVVLYLALTFMAQVLVSAGLSRIPAWARHGRRLLRLCQLTLAVGVASLIMDAIAPALHERFEDAFEWWLALLLNLNALWIALFWRRSGFHATPGVR